MGNNIQTKNRFVVFLDIMGFKDRVARNTPEELYAELTEFNKNITNILNSNQKIKQDKSKKENDSSGGIVIKNYEEENNIILAQFSDSIVLFSVDDSNDSLVTISKVTEKIMRAAIRHTNPIPLKGALAKGNVTCDMSKQLFFGQALIDAFLLEENVQYYGVVVHHTAEESVSKLNSDIYKNSKIYLKSGRIEHYELIWYKDNIDTIESEIDRIRLSVSDSPRKYIDNTKQIIRDFIDSQTNKKV